MPPRESLTSEQKGKAVNTWSDPPGSSVAPSDDSGRLHREALADTEGLNLSQRLLVGDAERLFQGEHDSDSRESETRDSEGNSADALSAIPAELLHSPFVEGQEWGKVGETDSTPGSMHLRDCGARGSPPVGYQCVYESYFQPDTRLWFPILRLITSYVFKRYVALSQFMNGSYRIVVALTVLAAEIDVSMNVQAFEELTSLRAQPHGLFSVKMRPNYNILTDHPNMTPGWNRRYFFIKSDKAAFYDLSREDHQRWPDISEEKIHRALAHDWTANLPCSADSGKKHLHLFSKKEQVCIKRSKKMKELPDLSALLGDELDLVGSNPISILDGMDLRGGGDFGESGSGGLLLDSFAEVCFNPVEEDKPLEAEIVCPKRHGKKRRRADCSFREGLNKSVVMDRDISSDEPLLRKNRKGMTEEKADKETPAGDDRLLMVMVPSEGRDSLSGTRAPIQDCVEFSYAGDLLLIRDPVQCTELIHQMRSGSESLPPSDGRMKLVVQKYDRSLKDTLIQLGRSEDLQKEKEAEFARKDKELREELSVALADRDRAVARREVRKRKMEAMGAELASVRAAATELEQKNAAVEVETEMIAKCNRRFEKIRDYQTRRDAYETACNLYGQASGTKKCLQKLIEKGAAIPHSMVDLFAVQERRLESEAAALEIGEIPEEDLSLSPLVLPSRFLEEHILAGLDPHGSNVDLVDSAKIVNLQVPLNPTDPGATNLTQWLGTLHIGSKKRSKKEVRGESLRSVFDATQVTRDLLDPLADYMSDQDAVDRLGSSVSALFVGETLTSTVAAEPVKAAYVPPKRIKPLHSSFYRVKVA
ncbi:hypothetical protein N665_0228s0003 [Sinapis alba]|nr:hypothetical protein N665_0228s0003 [Sinapis alba]